MCEISNLSYNSLMEQECNHQLVKEKIRNDLDDTFGRFATEEVCVVDRVTTMMIQEAERRAREEQVGITDFLPHPFDLC